MQRVKLDPEKIRIAAEVVGSMDALSIRLDRTRRQINYWRSGHSQAPLYIADQIEYIIREGQRKA